MSWPTFWIVVAVTCDQYLLSSFQQKHISPLYKTLMLFKWSILENWRKNKGASLIGGCQLVYWASYVSRSAVLFSYSNQLLLFLTISCSVPVGCASLAVLKFHLSVIFSLLMPKSQSNRLLRLQLPLPPSLYCPLLYSNKHELIHHQLTSCNSIG